MKTIKNLTLLMGLCAAVLLAVGCDKMDNDDAPSGSIHKEADLTKGGRFDINEDEFVTMRMSPEVISVNSPMKLIIENKAKGDLLYGYAFSLEYFDKESWTKIPMDDIFFEDIGLILRTGETEEGLFNTSEEFLSKLGRYRMVKSFTYFSNFLPKEDEEGNIVSFTLYAEFEVK